MTWPAQPLELKGHLGLRRLLPAPGGWILAGGFSRTGAAFSDGGWISRVDAGGRERWRHLTGSETDYVALKALAAAGEELFVGGSRTWRAGEDARGFVLRLGAKGKERWSFEFGQLETNGVGGLLAIPGGCLYARHEHLPTVENPGRDDWRGHDFLCRLDDRGQEQWKREVKKGEGIDSASVVLLSPWPGGCAWLVAAAVWGEGASDFPLLRVFVGEETREFAFRESEINEPFTMACFPSGGAAILGGVDWAPTGKTGPVLLRIGAEGEMLWERRYGDPKCDVPTCLAATPDGGLVLGGVRLLESEAYPKPQAIWLTRTDGRGEPLWSQTFHSGGANDLRDLALDGAGRVLALGSTRAPSRPETSWTISLDSSGQPDPWFRWRGKVRLRLPWF